MSIKEDSGNWEHPYLPFNEALKIADKIKEMGRPSVNALAKGLGVKNGGWFRLQLASVRRWGLAEGRGDLSVSQNYRNIKNEKKSGHALETKRELFLNITLFKSIFEKYKDDGLPQEPYFKNAIGSDYNLKGKYPSMVANIVREFISEYFPKYGTENYMTSPMIQSENKDNHQTTKQMDSPTTELLRGIYPIQIITKEDNFKWDVKSDVDWSVIDSVISSIKDRWKKHHKENGYEKHEKS